jgi:hypothetical protein
MSAFWEIIFVGSLFNNKSIPNWWLLFTTIEILHVLLPTENGLGHILGDYFSQSHQVTLTTQQSMKKSSIFFQNVREFFFIF